MSADAENWPVCFAVELNRVKGQVDPGTSYESLLDRGRREAVLRMKDQARRAGAGSVFNVKLETVSIFKGRENSVGSVEVLAYGTALRQR